MNTYKLEKKQNFQLKTSEKDLNWHLKERKKEVKKERIGLKQESNIKKHMSKNFLQMPLIEATSLAILLASF